MDPRSPRDLFESFVAEAAAGAGASRAGAESSTALVQRYFDMWNSGDGSVADSILGPTYLDHAHPEVLGPAAFRSLVPRFHAANPEARMTIEVAAADRELVAVRNTIVRNIGGELLETAGIALFRVAGGKLVEQWSWYPQSAEEAASAPPPSAMNAWLSFRA
jgi:predicted SnoaL-like aldol condensation-catalyzing enzyme